jgi:hypothetical protein
VRRSDGQRSIGAAFFTISCKCRAEIRRHFIILGGRATSGPRHVWYQRHGSRCASRRMSRLHPTFSAAGGLGKPWAGLGGTLCTVCRSAHGGEPAVEDSDSGRDQSRRVKASQGESRPRHGCRLWPTMFTS